MSTVASSAPQASLELAQIFSQYADDYCQSHAVTPGRRRVIHAVVNCRTAVLGGHREWCSRCGHERFHYHSCRNRHCPKCQALVKQAWVEKQQHQLLPVPYFHDVFTLPHELNRLILASEANLKMLVDLLFQAAAKTLLDFGENNLGGKVGFTMVLHTWDQQLRPHFHVHCVIPAGALAGDGDQWVEARGNFMFPVRALSKVFRGKYLEGLERLFDENRLDIPEYLTELGSTETRSRWLRQLRRKKWVVYSKPPFSGPQKVLDYLGRYTHRVAISNHRLEACENGEVRFTYRDRRDGNRKKTASLPAGEFINRFLTHVLPSGLMRIRHYGFLANRAKKKALALCREHLQVTTPEPLQEKTVADWMLELTGIDITRCPHCKGPLESEGLPPQPLANGKLVVHTSYWDTS